MSEWQPIETRPPDGDRNVVVEPHFNHTEGCAIAYDDDTGEALYMVWFASFAPSVSVTSWPSATYCSEITHWMPLPAPPDAL
jgi:hypothetical protein